MKKILIGAILSCLFITTGYGALTQEQTQDCKIDTTNFKGVLFDTIKVRVGTSLWLSDEIYNNTGTVFGLISNGSYVSTPNFSNVGSFLNAKGEVAENGDFKFTDWINNKKGILNPGERGIVLEGKNKFVVPFKEDLEKIYGENLKNINKDFMVKYYLNYKNVINGERTGDLRTHLECQPYTLSWCGDGIVDKEFNETCDPKDPTKKGWGTGGCSESTCTPVIAPAECKTIVSTPNTGNSPLNSTFSCEGLNATDYRIEIKNSSNQLVNIINSKTGKYNFTNPGTYTATCFADNKTSASCSQVITVQQPPKPEAICENLEVSKVSVVKGETATFTCNAKNTDNYKIQIVNEKGVKVKEIFGKTGTYTFPDNGTYIASCYVDQKTTTQNSCVKPVSVTEPIVPEIEVDKRDNNPADKDGNIGNDTQTVGEGEKAVFKITVTNNGTEELEDITLKDDVLESDVDAPMCDKSIVEINTILQAKFGRTSLKPGESFDYTCERPADSKDRDTYTNKIIVDGKGKISLKKVKDEDPTIVNKSKDPKIKVDKIDSNYADLDGNIGNDTQTIKESDKAIFKITVRNNGTEDLKNVFLVDDVLNNDIDAPMCDKSIDEVNNILKTIGNKDIIFNVGEVFDYTCERANHEKDTNPYINLIKVTGTGVTSGKVVKDEDPTEVKKQTEDPKIKVDKRDNNSADKDGTIGNDTQTIEKGVGVKAIFKITVTNNGKEELKDITLKDDVLESDVDAPMCDKSIADINSILQAKFGRTILKPGESFDYTCERETVATDGNSYTNKIIVDGIGVVSLKKVRDEDPTKVKKQEEGGGSPARCESISPSGVISVSTFPKTQEFTCKGSGSNSYELYINNERALQNNTGKFTFTFNDKGNYLVECKVGHLTSDSCKANITPTTSGNPPKTPPTTPPTTPNNGGGGGNNPKDYCGDGKVQRPSKNNPNGNGKETIIEECDQGSQNGKSGSWCTSECKLKGPETFPGHSVFEFGPKAINVIGLGMNPYTSYKDSLPKLINKDKESGGIYVYEICVTNVSKFATGKSFEKFTYCEKVDKPLNPGDTISMKEKTLEKVRAKLISSGNFEDNVLVTTITTHPDQRDGFKLKYSDTIFLSSVKGFTARVAKGTVKTTGGGNSYVSNTNISDVSEVVKKATKNEDGNKNFVGTSLTNFLSSYAKQISGEKTNEVTNTKTTTSGDLTSGDNAGASKNAETADFISYNGINGAYILKNKNFKIDSDSKVKELIEKVKGPVTYIVEDGDLYIDKDVVSINKNIAFVVKGGNIIIGKDVQNLTGTYISIPKKNSTIKGGKITSLENSDKKLIVSGSLYGNISDLASKRTHMKVNSNGQLDVGTVVSFGSSVFRQPAPLVSTFIDEYLKAAKVAQ